MGELTIIHRTSVPKKLILAPVLTFFCTVRNKEKIFAILHEAGNQFFLRACPAASSFCENSMLFVLIHKFSIHMNIEGTWKKTQNIEALRTWHEIHKYIQKWWIAIFFRQFRNISKSHIEFSFNVPPPDTRGPFRTKAPKHYSFLFISFRSKSHSLGDPNDQASEFSYIRERISSRCFFSDLPFRDPTQNALIRRRTKWVLSIPRVTTVRTYHRNW